MVTRRTHEIGIHMVIGGRYADITVWRGFKLSLLGMVIGLALAGIRRYSSFGQGLARFCENPWLFMDWPLGAHRSHYILCDVGKLGTYYHALPRGSRKCQES